MDELPEREYARIKNNERNMTETKPDKRVPAAAQESAHKPDSGCMTTPDGDCHGSGCMHNPTPDKRVPAELWSDLRDNLFSGDVELRERLEACPDITDEPELSEHCTLCGDTPAIMMLEEPRAGARLDLCDPCWQSFRIPKATLDPTAQEVLDMASCVVNGAAFDALASAVKEWRAGGRPTVVPAEKSCAPASGHRFEDGTCSDCGAAYNAVSPEDAATLQALRRCRELGVVPMQSATMWRVAFRAEFDRETLPEALAAYEAAQRQKVEDVAKLCTDAVIAHLNDNGAWAPNRPGVVTEVREIVQGYIGPRCPDKPEGHSEGEG